MYICINSYGMRIMSHVSTVRLKTHLHKDTMCRVHNSAYERSAWSDISDLFHSPSVFYSFQLEPQKVRNACLVFVTENYYVPNRHVFRRTNHYRIHNECSPARRSRLNFQSRIQREEKCIQKSNLAGPKALNFFETILSFLVEWIRSNWSGNK